VVARPRGARRRTQLLPVTAPNIAAPNIKPVGLKERRRSHENDCAVRCTQISLVAVPSRIWLRQIRLCAASFKLTSCPSQPFGNTACFETAAVIYGPEELEVCACTPVSPHNICPM
jgi:hypothetical protein